MLSERQLEALLKVFNDRMQGVTDEYLRRMGAHLAQIGSLTPSDVHRLTELKRMDANGEAIRRAIAQAASISMEDLERVLRAVAESDAAFARQWYGTDWRPEVKGAPKLSAPLERILKAQLRVTAQEMKNLSQTTVLSEAYRGAVDKAVQAVQTGMTDYQSAIRSALREAGAEGLRVQYKSGLTRRLDSAVRQNVLDGVRSLNSDVQRQLGNELGADGVEISAHALCAVDHLPYQGRQFSNEAFERIQSELDRPIGMWNCKHTIFPILLGISEPAYTDEELERFRSNSTEVIEIDGVSRTRYEWTQEQRRIETAVRAQKSIANLAKAAGDDVLRREAQANINALDRRYGVISERAGLYEQRERMAVSGFRRVKEDKNLTFIANDAKMKASSGLPKLLKGLPDEAVKTTAEVDLPIVHGVVPKGEQVQSVVVMAGSGTSTPIRDLRRLYATYPNLGNAADWQKKSGIVVTENFRYEIHWYEVNGKVPDAEIKTKGVRR